MHGVKQFVDVDMWRTKLTLRWLGLCYVDGYPKILNSQYNPVPPGFKGASRSSVFGVF